MKKIEFVIVVYNDHQDTRSCVESIAKMDSNDLLSCVIVDNSDDPVIMGLIDSIPDGYSFARILRPPNNLGYFGAFNYYFNCCVCDDLDCVVLCNNDLIFQHDFIDNLMRRKYDQNIFVVCPDVITLDGVHQNPHVLQPRTVLQRFKLDLYFIHYYMAITLRLVQKLISFFYSKKLRLQASQPGCIHMGIGACYALLPSFLEKFNNLSFPHFLYGEEAYLSKQVHEGGGRLFYDPELVVYHKESATLSKLPKRKTYEYGRDGYWSYRKFY